MRLSALSLHLKILLTILTLTIAIGTISTIIFIYNNLNQFQHLSDTFKDVINHGASISAAVAENQKTTAIDNLNDLKLNPDIANADIYVNSGNSFGLYNTQTNNQPAQHYLFNKQLELMYPIIQKNKTIGAIYITTKTMNEYLISLIEIIILIILIGSMVAIYIAELITRPITKLVSAMQDVAKNDYSVRIEKISEDETGILVDTFNLMMTKIQINTEELAKVSRMAAMAELSASILHNVMNVLNNVHTTTKLLNEKIRSLQFEKINAIANLIEENRNTLGTFFTENEKGKLVISYLNKSSNVLMLEQDSMLDQLREIDKYMDHIIRIITTQQTLSKSSAMGESIHIEDIINDVIAITQKSLEKNNIQLFYENKIIDSVVIVVSQVEQIILNLIRNAIDALNKTHRDAKQIKIMTYQNEDNIYIEVSDNGEGISKENMEKIFNFGFTTKKQGHGFGLHHSIHCAEEMGGHLLVKSEGENKGATFILQLLSTPKLNTQKEKSFET